jgi:hypothetical protein
MPPCRDTEGGRIMSEKGGKQMSGKINDGGPAFPQDKHWRGSGGQDCIDQKPGMSLRAYIATAALQGLLAFDGPWRSGEEHHWAKGACAHADALIAELRKEGT